MQAAEEAEAPPENCPDWRADSSEPMEWLQVEGSEVVVLGTAHVSRASADEVRRLLETGAFDAVAVELCPSRHNAVVNPDSLARMDLFAVIRQGKAPMVTASLALGAYQQRLAEQFDIQPGEEMRAAIQVARDRSLPVHLVDREIGTTLKRVSRAVPWWRRMELFTGLMLSLVSREKVPEEEIERLKQGDILESAFSQFSQQIPEVYEPLIGERDRYMAAQMLRTVRETSPRRMLAVVGAGHLKGIVAQLRGGGLQAEQTIAELDRMPPPARWPKVLPWLIVALVLTGFAIGFIRSPELGLRLVADWVLINGGLAALGAVAAAAHPVTIGAAFLAAPLTSLNPMVGAGMVTAGVETWVRRPTVADFSALRRDTIRVRGWWQNRVSRILLVFMLSTLGSAVGTYVAGFRIFERLTG